MHKELRRKGGGAPAAAVGGVPGGLCPDGYSYAGFTTSYRQWRGTIDVTMRQSHKAGESYRRLYRQPMPVWDRRTVVMDNVDISALIRQAASRRQIQGLFW